MGGCFLFEIQPFDSYYKRCKKIKVNLILTLVLKENYESIQFMPKDFDLFLLNDIGFKKGETLREGTGGFCRTIVRYIK